MIVDLTSEFHANANVAPVTLNSHEKSHFIEYSLRVLKDLENISKGLSKLHELIGRSGRLNNEQANINRSFIALKELLMEAEKKVRKSLVIEVDIQGAPQKTKQKFKQQVNMTLQCKLIQCSFLYKSLYETKVEMQPKTKSFYGDEDQLRYNQSHFLEVTPDQKVQLERRKEYQQIEVGMAEVTETYKSMMAMVKMQSFMVQKIGENTDCTYDNVVEGRRNLAEVNEKEKRNRQFIIKVFVVMYVFVFIYINVLL